MPFENVPVEREAIALPVDRVGPAAQAAGSESAGRALSSYRPREFQGRLNGGGNPVRLRTVNGKVRILALSHGI